MNLKENQTDGSFSGLCQVGTAVQVCAHRITIISYNDRGIIVISRFSWGPRGNIIRTTRR